MQVSHGDQRQWGETHVVRGAGDGVLDVFGGGLGRVGGDLVLDLVGDCVNVS